MTRYTRPPFQFDKPLFCKVPITHRGKTYGAGAHFKWKEMREDAKRVHRMYCQGYFYHSDEEEEKLESTVGDGLDEMTIDNLHKIVTAINAKVKALDNDKIRTCRQSNIKAKQIGHIRSWRLDHGDVE